MKKIILLIVPISLIVTGVVLLIMDSKNVNNAYIPNHSNVKMIEMSEKEYYKQEIINKSLEYLNNNNIVLSDNLSIDVNGIISHDNCTGNIQFKKQNDVYVPIYNVECLRDDIKGSTEFSSYVFEDINKEPVEIKKISDGYLVYSNINTSFTGEFMDNDINITKYDVNFNKIWSYDCLEDDDYEYISYDNSETGEDEEDAEDEEDGSVLFVSSIEGTIETDDKLFFFVDVTSQEDGIGDTRLLILNKDGSLYKRAIFDLGINVEKLVKVDGKNVILYGYDVLYEYNYETNKIIDKDMNIKDEGNYSVIGELNDNYLVLSSVSSYIEDNKNVVEGSYKAYILDSKFKESKSVDFGKILGFSDKYELYTYPNIYNNQLYIAYEMYNESSELEYIGVLILDSELNIVSNIKYNDNAIKKINKKLSMNSLIGYYVKNEELYILMDFDDDSYVLIDKYDVNGTKLQSSSMIETYFTVDVGDEYFYSANTLLEYNDSDATYYSIITYDTSSNKKGKSIIKFAKVHV